MKASVIERWWPLGQSLDLVESDVRTAAEAVRGEVSRFVQREVLQESWVEVGSLDHLFGSVSEFTNFPTLFFCLPTRSRWTVLWNNSFLCDGYDSLCAGLTRNCGLTTVHWSAHDDQTTFQPGASFTFRSLQGETEIERSVYCGRNDSRWSFGSVGEPLPEEDVARYGASRKRDRLNEEVLMSFLERIGARPWDEEFFDFGTPCHRLERTNFPSSIISRPPSGVVSSMGDRS